MILQPLTHENECTSVLIPEAGTDLEEIKIKQDIGLEEAQGFYYSVPALLRKYANNPKVILFLADML